MLKISFLEVYYRLIALILIRRLWLFY